MKWIMRSLLILLTLLGMNRLNAQISSTGKLFYLSFMEMEARTGGYPDSLLVYMTCEVNTTVVIDNPRIPGTNQTISLTAGKVNRYSADPGFYYPQGYEANSGNIESKRSLRITAKDPINVYTLNLELNRSDGTFVLPYESIPKAPEFYIAAYTPNQRNGSNYMPSEFVIVSMDNNVKVEITPRANLQSGTTKGTTFTVSLTRGQVYQVQSKFSDGNTNNPNDSAGDLTGTRVRVVGGCGKINVFSGMRSVKVQSATCGIAVDHLYTQVFPTSILGTKHVLMPFKNQSKGYVMKVIAIKPNTKIYVNGTLVATRYAGQQYYRDITTSVATCVTSDSEVYVVQYMKNGGTCAGTTGNDGDPAILIMPDQSQKMLKTVVGTATTNNMNKHFLNILVSTGAKAAVRLNGSYLAASNFTDVSCAGHSYAQIQVSNPSTNKVECDSGLIVVAYGIGQYESYSYCSGALFENLDYDFNITRNSKCPNYPVKLDAITTNTKASGFRWNFGDGFTDTGKSVTHSFKKTGSFFVVLNIIVPAACGGYDTVSRSKIIDVKQGPLYNMPDTLFQCTNSLKIDFQAPINSKYLYRWHDSTKLSSYSATKAEKVWLKITDTSTNCFLLDSTIVLKFNPIIANVSYDTFLPCISNNFFSLSDKTSFTGDSYKWSKWALSLPPYGFDSIITVPRFRFHSDTIMSYPLKYYVLSKNGCRDTFTTTLDIRRMPTAKIAMPKTEYCMKEMATFIDSSTGEGGITLSKWTYGDGGTGTGLKVTHAFTAYDTFNINLVTSTAYGCTDTADTSVIVHPLPVVKYTATVNNPCFKQNSFSFADNSTLAYGTMNNTWNYNKKTATGVMNLNLVKFSDTGVFRVTLINSTDKGCVDSTFKSIYVAPEPKVKLVLLDSSLCYKTHFFTLDDQSTIGSGTIAGRIWKMSNGVTNNNKTVNKFTFGSYGTYTARLVVTSTTYNCKDSTTKTLKVLASPSAAFNVNDSVQCMVGNSFSFSPTNVFSVSGVTPSWDWTFGDGNGKSTENATHSYASTGTYAVRYIVSTSEGCADTTNRTMKVSATPLASFTTSKDSACLGSYKFDFTNTTAYPSYNANWELGDGTKSTNVNVSQKTYGSAGNFKVKLVVTTVPDGCKDSTTKTVTLMPVPVAAVGVNNPLQCINGNSFVFSNNSILNGATGMKYNWLISPTGSTFNTMNIAAQSMVDTGRYKIDLNIQSGFGCSSSASINVYVAENPVVTITGDDACEKEDIQFNATASINSGSIASYNWTFGDGNVSAIEDPLHNYATAGTYNVSCTVTSNLGCPATDGPITATVFPNPIAAFSWKQTASRGLETEHEFKYTGGSTNIAGYLWSFHDGSTDVSGGPIIKTFMGSGLKTERLWLISNDGCVDSTSGNIEMDPELIMWIPNTFTPNVDDKNESFGPCKECVYGLTKYKMEIYDRWGSKLFESTDPTKGWDGNDEDKNPVMEGAYAYHIVFRYVDGKIFVYRGTVTIVR